MHSDLLQETSSTANTSVSFSLWAAASNYQSEAHVQLNAAAAVDEAERIVEEEHWIKSHYELVPKKTIAELARAYEARMARLPHKKYIDIDLPMMDDGGDW